MRENWVYQSNIGAETIEPVGSNIYPCSACNSYLATVLLLKFCRDIFDKSRDSQPIRKNTLYSAIEFFHETLPKIGLLNIYGLFSGHNLVYFLFF